VGVRFTIERMRALVLAAGVLLVVALAAFLVIGKWRSPFNRRDIPKRLGIDIQQEANGVTYTQAHAGHTLFKIHASRVVQLRDSRAVLHDVRIDLYGADGSRVDSIEGSEFEYDQKDGTATAAGPVEITLMRPGVAPAIAPKAAAGPPGGKPAKANPLAATARAAAAGEIHVKTSGLTFDQVTGVVTTSQRVDFSMAQGSGSAMGATFDSQQGYLVLDRAVELTTRRGGDTVEIHAQHAEFERDAHLCQLRAATADYRGGGAAAAEANIVFRDDGSAVRLEATGGFTLTTATGGRLAAPAGSMDFDERNRPRHGHLEGGVTMDSVSDGRTMHATAPAAELDFTPQGELRHMHLERGVAIDSEEQSQPRPKAQAGAQAGPLRVTRTWRSPVADIDFREAGNGQVEPAGIHGSGGVVVTGESRRGNAVPLPSRLAADEVTGTFGPKSALTAMTGVGHASIEDTTATGIREIATGDRLEAHLAPAGTAQIQSAQLDGNVVLVEQPVVRPGAQPEPPMRATAGRAVYESAGEWLHLTLSPRVEDGGLELTANKIDISQESGDAFAHGDVKATWADAGASGGGALGAADHPGAQGEVALGGQGPAHVIAAEAQLHRATDEATFRGHARLWQQDNSVSGPLIVLDRPKQTLIARSTDPADPVRVVLVSAGGLAAGREAGPGGNAAAQSSAPSVIRLRGGSLWYSGLEHRAILRGDSLGTVVAETGTATSVSREVELLLTPPARRAGNSGVQAQVDRMTASGRVVLTSQGLRGTGEQLVYTGAAGDYVLTGTRAAPPRMTDPERGTVTGEALIFHSRDDSVSIEGGGRGTITETTTPR
jgi:lipopolysaccharide export system protein LptA